MEYCLISEYMRHPIAENVWYYRDRMSTPRGPCTLPVLREAWVNGVIDGKTLVWGQGLADWLPARNVTNLVWQVETLEVRLATWIKRKLVLDPARRRKEARDLASGRSVPVRFDPELVSALLPRLAEHLTDAEADRLMAVVGQTAVDQAAKDAADSEGCERDKALLRKRIKEWEKLRSKAKGRKTAAGAKQG